MCLQERRRCISTHTSLAGRDILQSIRFTFLHSFLLTRPSRDVTILRLPARRTTEFLLTRPSRDVTALSNNPPDNITISTHTSLAGRDIFCIVLICIFRISTHTSLAGRDTMVSSGTITLSEFLLTRPSRDVTEIRTPPYVST